MRVGHDVWLWGPGVAEWRVTVLHSVWSASWTDPSQWGPAPKRCKKRMCFLVNSPPAAGEKISESISHRPSRLASTIAWPGTIRHHPNWPRPPAR
jgi:hypothetical protein